MRTRRSSGVSTPTPAPGGPGGFDERGDLVVLADHLLHAARGELLLRADRAADAVAEFGTALAHAVAPTERRHLERRLRDARRRR